jgi:hypothetical protein
MPETTENNGSTVKFSTAAERIGAEVAEILGPDNKRLTVERVGHEPTRRDCFEQWRKSGGRKRFVATHALAA